MIIAGCFWGSSILFLESDTANKTNLVKNPSFEKTDKSNPSLPEGWLVVSSTMDKTEPVELDSMEAFEGSKSLRFTNCTKDLYIVSDAFNINPTGGFFSKCSVRSTKQMLSPIKVYFWAYDSQGNKKNSFRDGIKAKQDWKKATISAGFLHNSVRFGRIAIFIPKDPDNTIWIDDIGSYQVHQFARE
jgi:hypothetical protein